MSEQSNVNQGRLFLGSCLALIATSVAFAVIGDIMGTLKNAFVLTNAEVGMIGGGDNVEMGVKSEIDENMEEYYRSLSQENDGG